MAESDRWKRRVIPPHHRIRAILLVLVVLGVVSRLYSIYDGLPLDQHWLRQYDTAAIARNFSEGQ